MTILIYLLIGASSFFFVLVPITGGIVLNPLLSMIVDPHTAISLAVFFFMINSTIKAIIFRKSIVMKYVTSMLPISVVTTVLGSFAIGIIPEMYLYVVMLLMTLFFALKKAAAYFGSVKPAPKNRNSGFVLMSMMTGFMQGTGLGGGGSLRKVYFLSEGLSLAQMHGTTSAISVVLGTVAIGTRLQTEQVTFDVLMPILFLIPIMTFSILFGKKVLVKLNERTSDIIIMITLALTIILLASKLA